MPKISVSIATGTSRTYRHSIGKRWRKWPSYVIGLPFFLVALFFFFENFSLLLPSNY